MSGLDKSAQELLEATRELSIAALKRLRYDLGQVVDERSRSEAADRRAAFRKSLRRGMDVRLKGHFHLAGRRGREYVPIDALGTLADFNRSRGWAEVVIRGSGSRVRLSLDRIKAADGPGASQETIDMNARFAGLLGEIARRYL